MKIIYIFIICLTLSVYKPEIAFAQTGLVQADEVKIVEIFHTALLAAMKSGVSCAKRREMLRPVLEESFNLDRMAKLSVGSAWRKMNADEKNNFLRVFKSVTYNTYAKRFKHYKGEKFVTIGTKQGPGKTVVVETKLIKASGEPVKFNYLLRNSKKTSTKIIDIFLQGNISELAMKKSDYTSILESSPLSVLIEKLQEKVDKMECNI